MKMSEEMAKHGEDGLGYEIVKAVINGDIKEPLSGKAFINDGRDTVYTKCYSILIKGYQLLIITSSISEDGSEDLSKIVNTLEL